ncbi:ion channel DMI1 isoform X1 [Tanacetum coccineum]
MRFEDVLVSFPDAIPCGVKVALEGGKININPSDEYILREGDEILVIAEDDDTYSPGPLPEVRRGIFPKKVEPPKYAEKILFCGWRRDIDDMIMVLEALLAPGSELWMFNEVLEKERETKLVDGGLDISGLVNIKLVHRVGNAVIKKHLETLPLETFDSNCIATTTELNPFAVGYLGLMSICWRTYEDCDDGSRSEENLVSDAEIVKIPTQPATTEKSSEDGGIRRSGRLKCKGPIIEENSIDEAIDVDEYLSDEEGSDYSGEMQGDNTADGINKIEDEKDEKITKKRKKDNTMGKQEGKKLKREKKSPSKKYKGVGTNTYIFQTRNSPRAFFNAISKLSPIQKSCLEQLGFGKLLHFKVEGIPSKLGFYVVNNFDETTMEIKLENASLLITMESIADMIGISNEGVDIFAEHVVKDAQMIKNWEDQFGGIKNINANHVKRMIRNSRVADMNFKLNFIVLFTSVMGCVKSKGICDLSVLNHIRMDTDLAKVNWCSYCWRCLKKCKDGWKNTVTNSFFLGPITLLTTKELLKERELAKIKCGGLGKGELAGPYLEEQDDPIPDNLEVVKVCIQKMKQWKMKVENKVVEPGERTGRGLDSPRYQLGPQTQAIVCETTDKLYKESERKKMMDFSDIPEFSLGCKADKVENMRKKHWQTSCLNKRDGDESDVMFKTKYGHQSSRGQIETLGPQEPVDNNDTKLFAVDNAYTLEMFMEYAENANSSYGGPTMLEKADIVFIPVSNDQQKFLVCVNLKNPAVTFIDSKKEGNKVTRKKKKDDGVDDMRVATILHRNFGQYLYAINHAKAAKIIQSQIVRGNFSWQTNRRAKDCGIFLMRHMECYMGSDNGKWKCGLDVEGKKQNTQLGRLRNKYAAKLLLSDCNIYKGKIREEMDGK